MRPSRWLALGAGALFGVACSGSQERGDATRREAVALWLPPAAHDAPSLPGPAPRRRTFDAAKVNAACEGCHVDIAAEWAESLHHHAHTDPTYRLQFEKEPLAFCTGCHAPETPSPEVPAALSELGVGCVTCHVVGDTVLASPEGASAADGTHHALTRSPDFASPAACAACHEFAFPGARGLAPLLMQATITEHALSRHANESCASCHMPLVPGPNEGPHRSHRFAASRDAERLRAAVDVAVSLHAGSLTLRMTPKAVGHAFPTGDMLRRLTFVVEVRDVEQQLVAVHTRQFARHFGFARAPHKPPRRVLLHDDRLSAAGHVTEHRYAVPDGAAGGRLSFSLRYERVSDPTTGAVEGFVVLAAGELTL